MPVVSNIVPLTEMEEFNTSSIDMGAIGNRPLPPEYYNPETFTFTEAYSGSENFVGFRIAQSATDVGE